MSGKQMGADVQVRALASTEIWARRLELGPARVRQALETMGHSEAAGCPRDRLYYAVRAWDLVTFDLDPPAGARLH